MRRVHLISALMLILSVMVFTGCRKSKLPTVSTSPVTDVTATSCVAGGVVISSGEEEVVERGICWGEEEVPEIMGSHIPSGAGLGSFSCKITGLKKGATYYVRAYALSEAGMGYGESVSFTTLTSSGGGGDGDGDEGGDDGGDDGEDPVGVPEGAINGLFSVSATEKVYFSQGNLQYNASNNIWHFADHQYDYIGQQNKNIAEDYDGFIDLFGWGTSNHPHGAICYQPWSISPESVNYLAYGNSSQPLYAQTGEADWGCNRIDNGGNEPSQWRTLSSAEWNYVFMTRSTNSGIRFAKAKVNEIRGVILLPDHWKTSYFALNSVNSFDAYYSTNTLSLVQFSVLEQHGAVFLPCAGVRTERFVETNINLGHYWSATGLDIYSALDVCFNDYSMELSESFERRCGLSVRLVQSVQ